MTVTNKEIYERQMAGDEHFGMPTPRDFQRFAFTLARVGAETRSLLDVGCHVGDWLNYVVKTRSLEQHLGIDVAENKVAAARQRYPGLDVRAGFAEELDLEPRSFDVVTCLEVLEHIPDWLSVFHSLFRFARKQVLVSVPYRETILQTVCIHCAQTTPLYGHLRSYDDDSFPAVDGWEATRHPIPLRDPARSLAWRLYRRIRPVYPWLLVSYRAVG